MNQDGQTGSDELSSEVLTYLFMLLDSFSSFEMQESM